MTPREQLIKEIEQVPEPLIKEVLGFLEVLKDRQVQDQSAQTHDTSGAAIQTPIWELFEEAAQNLPEEVVAQLPTDGAAQIDHYLYGTPKR
jgi:hypothetical protein